MTPGRACPRQRIPARPAGSSQQGQATVELAMTLPLVAVLLLLLVQAGLIARDQVLVTHAAREAARTAAVDPGADVQAIVGARTDLPDITASASTIGDTVRVDVRALVRIRVPLLAAIHATVALDATAIMRIESG